jgi:hypothetical protein
MVEAVRSGRSLRAVAEQFKVSVGTVAFWVERARGKRLDRVAFSDRKPGRAWNRTAAEMERRIVGIRGELRDKSVLGEYGADAIGLALQGESSVEQAPSRATMHRVLARHGALDGVYRNRRPAPPKGWYLSAVASGQAELDSFDFIEDLKIAGGPLISVLTATRLHGALVDAWVVERPSAQAALELLLARWRQEGLPVYAQFDNDTIFQGAHQFADAVGRISRLCLALKVIPVFAPPREPGFQNAIEGFNGLWQAKVWQRHHCATVEALVAVSQRYISAYRSKTAARRDSAPDRRAFPKQFKLDLNAPLKGTIISCAEVMKTARFICSEDLFASPNSGCIDSFAVRLTLRANACASMHYVVATPMTNRFSANCLITVLTNPSKANHDCSTNAQ